MNESNARAGRLIEVFDQASACPPGAAREKILNEECGDDRELRREVDQLLSADAEASRFLSPSEAVSPELEAQFARLKPEEAGERIGHYKLLQEIGQGGFGTVWMADQEHPVKRRVALKIIKMGMDTREVIARFEQERQALALMDHPNIARVFDAGATPFGRPFFVMELVKGVPITEFCDEHQLDNRQRLELFGEVCSAINHAHQKGVIHRDIKPSNVMITLHGDKPVVKVIDFGIAKATQGKLTEKTLFTRFEQFIGTPVYMSPEQAATSGLDIDTRSDIYALGILLYELLTGKPPFDAQSLASAGYEEMRRIIREVEPPKPSSRLSTIAGDERTRLARARHVEPDKLSRLVEPDLDWIVMKAIEKDRTRRYETANGLALDIQRFLAHEPVSARPASQLYRLRRLARRNRVAFAAAGAVAAALIVGLSVAIHSLLNERAARAGETKQREIAEQRSRQAQTSAEEATASELKARRFLYAADMNLVQQALRSNNVGRARLLLDRHRPGIGEQDLRGWEWRYLWQECRSGAQVMLTKRDGQMVFSASFSRDGTLLLAGYADGKIELWETAARRLRKVIQPPCGQIARVAFSPDGRTFAALMERQTVKTLDIETGAETLICALPGGVRDLSYSRDGEWLAVLTQNPDFVTIRRAKDGDAVMSFSLPKGGGMLFNNVRISPDKQRLYVSCAAFAKPYVRCISVPDARVIWEMPIGLIEESDESGKSDIGFSAMDLSPDGRTLVVATGCSDRQLRVLDAESGQLLKKLSGHTGYILQLAFSPDGRFLASTSQDQTVRLWDATTWTRRAAPLRGHNHEVTALAISDASHLLASGNKEGELLLWDTRIPRPASGRHSLPPHIEIAKALPVNRMVVGRAADGKWSLIDLLTLAEEPLPDAKLSSPDEYPGLTPKGRSPLTQKLDGNRLGLSRINASALSPDGKVLAVGTDNGLVGLYEPSTLKKIDIIRSNQNNIFGVAFSPDNQRLVLASGGEHGIALWDAATRQDVLSLSSPDPLLYAVEFTDDGNTLLVGSRGIGSTQKGSCQFWQAPSWTEIEDTERANGRWSQTASPNVPPPAPTYAELKVLLEQGYREKLVAPRAQSAADLALLDGNLASLVDLLRQQRRDAELEPLLRTHLENLRQRTPRNDEAVFKAATNLLSVLLSLIHSGPDTVGPGKLASYERQADALVGEILELLAQRVLSDPNDMLFLKVTALQVWFGRNADHLAICRRLIEQAERKPKDGYSEERAVRAWHFGPSSDPALLTRTLRLARHAAEQQAVKTQRGWYQQTLGMAEYRSGNDAAAEQAMIRAEESSGVSSYGRPYLRACIEGTARLFRAMIRFRQGKEAEAQKLFAQAEAQMKPLPTDPREVLLTGADQDDLLFWLTYKEAKALLQPQVQAAPAKAQGTTTP